MKRKSRDSSVYHAKVPRPSTSSQSVTEEPWPVKSGMIMEVTLKNFMCHEKFQFIPNQRLNFLVGENGSGKSAILAAILFGLGSNARATHRGSSNKNFIRSGQSSATVEIRLCNTGVNRYREELFGDSVIVSRTVTETTSQYKMKDTRGKVVYDKKVKEELDKMLEFFSIQIDNPMIVLDQDNSKTFLSKSDPNMLYKLFHRSSQLKNVEDDYFQAQVNLEESQSSLKRKEESIQTLKEEYRKWRKMKEYWMSMKVQEEDIQKLKTELAWIAVKDAEKKLDDIKKNKEREMKKVEMAQITIDKQKVEDKEARKKKSEIEQNIQQINSSYEEKNSARKIKKTVLVDKSKEVPKYQRTVKDLERKIKATKVDLKKIMEAIENNRNSCNEFEARSAARKQEIQDLEAEVEAMTAQIEASENHRYHLQNNVRDVNSEVSYITQQTNSVNVKLGAVEQEIRALETGERNKLAAFGQWMPNLVKEIKRCASKFSKMPIGPLGAHFTVKDGVPKNVITIIEGELGGLLHAFCCDNNKDQLVLYEMFTRLRVPYKPLIFTSEFSDQPYNIESTRVRSKYTTLIDCIETTDPTVFNTLVDQAGMENVIVMESSREAQNILSKVETVPANLRYAVVENKYQYYPAPEYKTYPKKYNPKNILKASIEELIQDKKKTAEELRNVRMEHENKVKQTKAKLNEAHRLLNQETSKITAVRSKKSSKVARIATLTNEDLMEKPADIVALEEDEIEFKQNLENQLKELEAAKVDLEAARQGEAEAKASFEEAEKEFNDFVEQINPLKKDLSDCEDEIKGISARIDHYILKKKEHQNKADSFDPSIKDQETEIEKANERAGVFSTVRMKTKRSMEEAKQDLMKVKSKLEKMTDSLEPKDTVMDNYLIYQSRFSEKKTELHLLNDMLEKLESALKERRHGYRNILRQTAQGVQRNFTTQLEHRKFLGVLHFDHNTRTLIVKVNPHDTENAGLDVDRDLKSLSGGEKSYTLISFILALWQVMSPPFRILDEFDVFMDAVNRRISVNNIINFTKKDRRNQFIFLTPLGTDNITVDNDIQIIKLKKLQNH